MHEASNMARNAKVNWAENALLSHKSARSTTKLAIVGCKEPHPQASPSQRMESSFLRSLTYDQLYTEVAQAAAGLKKLGVKAGDRVAALIPNNPGESTLLDERPLSDIFMLLRGCCAGLGHLVARCYMDFFAARIRFDRHSRTLPSGG